MNIELVKVVLAAGSLVWVMTIISIIVCLEKGDLLLKTVKEASLCVHK